MGLNQTLAALARVRKLKEALRLVDELEQGHKFTWRPVGDREGNFGSINIGSDPGYAFVERVTNAIDAVIEREALRRARKRHKVSPLSPREAGEAWFGVPGGRISNLPIQSSKSTKGAATRQDLANEIVIKILDGDNKKNPTIEILDHGVGLTPSIIPRTILSLNENNKIDKPYLAGAYGQGGSTALAFSPYGTLITSRRQPDLLGGAPDVVAVTIARFNELDPKSNKNGRYEYLVGPDNEVAWIDHNLVAEHQPGTSVVHFNLEIPHYSARLTQLTGSLWWLLQNSLFDPVLPFWVEERRLLMLEKGKDADRRTIAGNYTRLTDDRKDRVEYLNSVDVKLRHQSSDTTIRVNYWVLRVSQEDPGRAPTDSYVDPYRPIVFTFNGQSHGTEERRFITDRLSLTYLAKFLIIQIELDHLNPRARRDLLSTTRDRLKQLSFYDDMREAVVAALSEDEDLARLNDERKERLLLKHSEKEQARMRERFARLMERFRAGLDISVKGGGNEAQGRKTSKSGGRHALEPLPTLDEPTFLRIANVQKPIPIGVNRHALIRLESDAPDGYLSGHVHARLSLSSEPDDLVALESRSDFQGGRSRLTVRAAPRAKDGQTGTITVFLLTPKNETFTARANVKIEEPEEEPASGRDRKSNIQAPAPIAVYRDEWGDYGWNEESVAEVHDEESDIKIFVNMDNRHLVRLLASASYQEVGVKRMRTNFLLYVAFYAWMKHVSEKGQDIGLEGEQFEAYQARELDRVAQTVVHSISSASRLDDEE